MLFETAQKREEDLLKFEAAIHGCNIPDTPTDSSTRQATVASPPSTTQSCDASGFMTFRDPAEYEKMTWEERVELTKKMKATHKRWAGERVDIGVVEE